MVLACRVAQHSRIMRPVGSVGVSSTHQVLGALVNELRNAPEVPGPGLSAHGEIGNGGGNSSSAGMGMFGEIARPLNSH